MTRRWMWAVSTGAVALAASTGWAGSADDDLSVVKKAVSSQKQEEPARVAAEPRMDDRAPARAKGEKPRWLRVRVVGKTEHKARVSINLPLDLVRALPDDVPIDLHGHRFENEGHRLRISEILKALDTGQSLVEIQDEDATVKVWLE